MNVSVLDRVSDPLAIEPNRVRNLRIWLLAIGILQILAGVLAASFAFAATMVSVVTLGILLIVSAAGQTAAAVVSREWGGFLLFVLLGIFYAVAGFLTIQHPVEVAEGLTLMLAAVYLIGGIFRIVSAFVERLPSRGWVLCNGILGVLVGVFIWRQWPVSGLWVIGLFIGIDLIVNGMTWTMLAVRVRHRMTRVHGG